MFDKRIIKVSSDCSSFIDIDGLLNIENKSFSFVLSIEEYITLFKSDPIKGLEPTNLYFLDENSIKYTCFNCIIGFNMFSNIHITCSSIDLILENIFSPVENILVDEIVFQTSFPKSNSLICYIENINFDYSDSISIDIKKDISKEYNRLIISASSKTKINYKDLDNYAFYTLELLFLLFGCMPKLENFSARIDSNTIVIHFNLVDKYQQNLKNGSTTACLIDITKDIFTKELLEKFIQFRNDTLILYDIFMINVNSYNYVEIKNSMYVQLLEGTYRTIISSSDCELWEILKYYFKDSPVTNMLLNSYDLQDSNNQYHTAIFLHKSLNHRNYLSHLNVTEQKNIFYQLENNYAQMKFIICLRLTFMNYLGLSPDNDKINRLLNSITKWYEDHNLKF